VTKLESTSYKNFRTSYQTTLKEEKQEQVNFPSAKIGNHKVMYFFNEFCDVMKVMIIHMMI
jgi:hypothetical protein